MIWTLFGELARRSNASELLTKLLNQITSKCAEPTNFSATASTLMIEQSFSGFGDADALILLKEGENNRCVFIEAKVCCGKPVWHVDAELSKFKKDNDSRKKAFSNLFCQLYAKQCLIETLRRGAIPEEGVDFLEGFKRLKIGKNKVVHRAVALLSSYVQHATYVALVPSTTGFDESIREFETLTHKTCAAWAVLSWAQVENFCHTHELTETRTAFEYNRSQIY